MATYGGSNKNLFTIPTTGANKVTNNSPTVSSQLLENKYNVQVNTETKIAQVYLQGKPIAGGVLGQGGDVSVGTIDLRTGKFTPDANRKLIADTNPSGNAVEAELRYFNSQDGTKQLKEVSSLTVQNDVIDNGGSVSDAKTAAQNLTGVDPGRTGNANTLAQQDPNLNQSLQSGTEEGTAATLEGLSKAGEILTSPQLTLGKDRLGTRDIKNYPSETLLRYPLDMDGKQDCIKFTMLKYSPKKFSPSGFATGDAQLARQDPRSDARSKERGSTVTLPIQPTVSDSNVVKWGAEDMNAFQAIAAATALSAMGDDFKTTGAIPESIGQLISTASPSLKTAVMAHFAENAAQVKGLLTRATGGIINPNTELFFQGPDLRTFNFTFSLSAREPEEAKRIRNIIRFFKQGMSVKRAETGLFLKSPHTFEIKYMFGGTGKDHPWINKIKECALVSCNVNYTPAGNYATYEDGAMTQYDISLSFSELEPIYDDDYTEADKAVGGGLDSSIGY